MKILQTYQNVLAIAYPQTAWIKTSLLSILPTFYMLLCCIVISCYLFFENGTFQTYCEIFYLLATVGINTIYAGMMYFKRPKLFAFIDTVESSIEKRFVNSAAKAIYVEANELIEKWCNLFYFVFCKLTAPCLGFPYVVSCYFLYFTTDLGDEAFVLPFSAWLPIDWKTPFMYLLVLVLEAICTFYTTIFCSSSLGFEIAFCWMLMAFAKDIHCKLIALNKIFHKMDRRDSKFLKKLRQLIQMHQNGRQMACDMNGLFYLNPTGFFLWTVATMCDSMLLVQTELKETNPNVIILSKSIILTFWSFMLMIMLCESSQKIVERFEKINIYYKCDWYLFPPTAQRILPIIIANSDEVVVKSFGGVSFTRDFLKKVVNGGFSYFMMVKRLLD